MIIAPNSFRPVHPVAVNRGKVDLLVTWLMDGARSSRGQHALVEELCRRAIAAGIPLDRFALVFKTLHPHVAARRFLWTAQGAAMHGETATLVSRYQYFRNPFPLLTATQAAIRRRLTNPAALEEFMILGELREQGFTDYLAQPLIFTTGETHAATFSTMHPTGFTVDHLAALERLRLPLARLVESYLLRLNAVSILSTYVGRASGEQILHGRVRRGDGEEISAAILFADLVGFTGISNRLSGKQTVEHLNDAFDVVVPSVEGHGGEILKFLGDGFLAIFPYGGATRIAEAVRAARETVLQGEARLAEAAIGQRVAFRWALHAGRFHYGNVGGANRLDFTAVGRPVNYAARLLSTAADLALPRVASAEVAAHLCPLTRMAAEVEFRGFEGKQKIYAW